MFFEHMIISQSFFKCWNTELGVHFDCNLDLLTLLLFGSFLNYFFFFFSFTNQNQFLFPPLLPTPTPPLAVPHPLLRGAKASFWSQQSLEYSVEAGPSSFLPVSRLSKVVVCYQNLVICLKSNFVCYSFTYVCIFFMTIITFDITLSKDRRVYGLSYLSAYLSVYNI